MSGRWDAMRRAHLVGIGGVGMCGLAEVLLDDGVLVSGCDTGESERTRRLGQRGVTVACGHDPAHVREADAVVVSAAVPPGHPEVEEARRSGLAVLRRAEMLSLALRDETLVAVSGTHGKTTTSALLAHLLERTGAAPTFVVGGLVRSLNAFGRRGAGGVAVCEADEFDRAFLELDPTHAVVTNVDADHLDYYGSMHALRLAFADFVGRVPAHGVVHLCGDDAGAADLGAAARGRVIRYGTSAGNPLRATDVEAACARTTFTVVRDGRELGRLAVPLSGMHNVRNALAAVGVALELGADLEALAAAAASFAGVGRRFEVVGERGGVTVVDDYAHHPTEVAAVLDGAAQTYPGRRLVVVFQPHLFSRTREHGEAFGRVLGGVGVLVVLPVYAAREAAVEGVSHAFVLDAARRRGSAEVVDGLSVAEAPGVLDGILAPGDVLMTVGAGDVDAVGRAWLGGRP